MIFGGSVLRSPSGGDFLQFWFHFRSIFGALFDDTLKLVSNMPNIKSTVKNAQVMRIKGSFCLKNIKSVKDVGKVFFFCRVSPSLGAFGT